MYIPEDILFSERSYVAPTVFSEPGRYVSSWNYYSSLQQVIEKWKYLNKAGGTNYPPVGAVSFANDQKPHTFGFNCDFYLLKDGEFQLTSYGYLKTLSYSQLYATPIVFRFIRTDGAGIYYAIFNALYFGMSATAIRDVDPDRIAALDAFYREVQLMKYRYNSLVGFLNSLGKKTLNQYEQQAFNEGLLLLNTMNQQIATIKGIELQYSDTGAIGNPVILIILIVVILSAATAWTISSIQSEKEKTKRINDSFELTKWIATKKQEIAMQVASGAISQSSADDINKTLDEAAKAANTVANNAAKPTGGILSDITTIVKWGVVGLILVNALKLIKPKANAV